MRTALTLAAAAAATWGVLAAPAGLASAGNVVALAHQPPGAADFGVHLVDLSGESVWRQPFGHCIRIMERAIDFLRRGTKHAVKSDGICGGF